MACQPELPGLPGWWHRRHVYGGGNRFNERANTGAGLFGRCVYQLPSCQIAESPNTGLLRLALAGHVVVTSQGTRYEQEKGVDVRSDAGNVESPSWTVGNALDEATTTMTEAVVEPGSNGKVELPLKVVVGSQSISAYASAVGEEQIEELRALARPLSGARVLHVNSTPYGGGVAELLRSQIPLLRSLGIDADWVAISGDEAFFNVTKGFHNALQGGESHLDERAKEIYLANNSRYARTLGDDYDYIVVHDPQPAALRLLRGQGHSKWVWRCHIDTSNPAPQVWEFLKPYVEPYDAAVYTMEQYVSSDLPQEKIAVIPPAIDPLSPKNTPLSKEFCRKLVSWVGVDVQRPLITQVSRFDPWKDPLGCAASLPDCEAPDTWGSAGHAWPPGHGRPRRVARV